MSGRPFLQRESIVSNRVGILSSFLVWSFVIDSARPQIVGILNVTPNSFSDGGAFVDVDVDVNAAVSHAQAMIEQGADMIDIGGESTRPGAARVDAAEQIARVVPVIERLAANCDKPISIDTTRAAVVAAALDAGASVINDVSAGTDDPGVLSLAAERRVPIILMHMRGQPANMQDDPQYDDVVTEVRDYLLQRAGAAQQAGVAPDKIILDPGIGFGKTTAHNLALLARLDVFVATGYDVMLGASRKRFLGELTGADDPRDRAIATAATTALGVNAGVRYFRVHDVVENRQAADVTAAVLRHPSG
jgi:dihydropteroate synthase